MSESTKADLQTWRQLASKELRGADPDSLTWHTLEGIEVKPLYTQADVQDLPHLGTLPGIEPFTRLNSCWKRGVISNWASSPWACSWAGSRCLNMAMESRL